MKPPNVKNAAPKKKLMEYIFNLRFVIFSAP